MKYLWKLLIIIVVFFGIFACNTGRYDNQSTSYDKDDEPLMGSSFAGDKVSNGRNSDDPEAKSECNKKNKRGCKKSKSKSY